MCHMVVVSPGKPHTPCKEPSKVEAEPKKTTDKEGTSPGPTENRVDNPDGTYKNNKELSPET